jgi:hypothetical protein
MELSNEQKATMKNHRLTEYKGKIFNLQMDIAALEAIGDTVQADTTAKVLSDIQKAYNAVECM